MTVTVRLTTAAEPMFAGAAALFDEYRQYYGANPAPHTVVAEWMLEQVLSSHARIYAGAIDGVAQGICSVAVAPAALALRTVWLIRDLYVAPTARRHGVARALITQVAEDARVAGAHRLSLQTETANVRAIELYARSDFSVITDVAVMDRML